MSKEDEAVELYRKFRPKNFKQVIGQPEAVKQLSELLKNGRLPQVLQFSGASGCGKTTLARILASKLNAITVFEINAAETRGIDTIRDTKDKQGMSIPEGHSRVWIWDECHKLTGDAQTAMLKMIEDVYPRCYHFLCTTDPQKLLPTIRSRCTEIKIKPIAEKTLTELVLNTWAAEFKCEHKPEWEKVSQKIAEVADGSARKALVLLHQVMGLETEQEQLDAVQRSDTKRQAIELARAMMDPNKKWPEIAAIITGIEDDSEGIRRLVFAYASSVLAKATGKKAELASLVMFNFRDSKIVFDNPGKGGLLFMANEVASNRK